MTDESRDAYRLGRVEKHVETLDRRMDGVEGELAETRTEVGIFKRVMYWVAVLLTGSIIALIGAAVTIVLTAGGPK